ncbi:MAG: hypothetical protein C5B49_02990 [Bdellovibrio sp.]|nr:MAG: hypothetical protein C5B49_02990 [Bdellovibrio sp.]
MSQALSRPGGGTSMAVHELSEKQIGNMTLLEKDTWWLRTVYRGDMPQLNLRSGLTGIFLGGILSLTNLYIGIRTGWALGVGVTAVILSYALFRVFSILKIGREMSILENSAMQSVATSAGYMMAPLVASIPAYMIVTGEVIPMWQTLIWICLLSLLGVLFAFPMKKRFINDEQLPFPEGRAAGIVLDQLHSDLSGQEGFFRAKLLMAGMALSSMTEMMRSQPLMNTLRLGFLSLPDHWDDFIYRFATPHLMGTPLRDLTIQVDSSVVLLGSGGLMSKKSGISLLVGAFLNYFILAPWLISAGIIHGTGFKNIPQ